MFASKPALSPLKIFAFLFLACSACLISQGCGGPPEKDAETLQREADEIDQLVSEGESGL